MTTSGGPVKIMKDYLVNGATKGKTSPNQRQFSFGYMLTISI